MASEPSLPGPSVAGPGPLAPAAGPAPELAGDRIAAELAQALPPDVASCFDAAFVASSLRYEEYVLRLAVGVLRAAGVEATLDQPGTAAEVAARAGLDAGRSVVPLDWMLRYATARGLLERAPGPGPARYRAAHPLPHRDPALLRAAQAAADPGWLPAYDLADVAARGYPAVLRGEATGEDVLLVGGGLRLWAGYFSNANGLYAVNNRVGALAVERWLAAEPEVILELGGGLGSGALALLGHLAATGALARVRAYRFTELVPAFLRRGQRELEAAFGDRGILSFAPLDMDRPWAEQGVAPGSVSTVYGVNTLHVARDLDATLDEIRRALRPGGQLIVSECVRPHAGAAVYAEFVFNLLETFRAPRLAPPHRPTGGFLTPEQWTGMLEAAGFERPRFLPDVAALRARFPAFCVAALRARRPA